MSDVSTRDSLPQSAPAAFRVDLSIADERGTTLPVQVIARDGSPPSDHSGATLPLEETRESQLLPPPGTEAYLVTHAFDTCCAGDRLPGRRLVIITTLATATTPGATARVEPASARNLFGGLLAKHTERRRVIAMTEYPRPGVSDQVDFYIVERKPGSVLGPYPMGDAPAITVKARKTEEWAGWCVRFSASGR